MADIVAYPDISFEKFTGLDPSEDVADFLSLKNEKSNLHQQLDQEQEALKMHMTHAGKHCLA